MLQYMKLVQHEVTCNGGDKKVLKKEAIDDELHRRSRKRQKADPGSR